MDETFEIDFKLILQNFGEDEELLQSTIALSLKLIPQHVEKIHKALADKNAKNLEVAAHTLKGSLSIYLYPPITNLAFELEKLGRASSFSEAPEVLKKLEELLIPFFKILKNYISKSTQGK